MLPYLYIQSLTEVEDGLIVTRVQSAYEFYNLIRGKKSFKGDNIKPCIGRKYYSYSSFSNRFYERDLGSEAEIMLIKPEADMGLIHITWTEQERDDLRWSMAAISKHYKLSKELLSYHKQYIPLMENTLLYASYRANNKESVDFWTNCNQYELRNKKLLSL